MGASLSWDRNAYLARWREENRLKLREYHRNYQRALREKDPEKAREMQREIARRYREKNREKVRATARRWHRALSQEKKRARSTSSVKNRESIREAARRWALRHPEKKNAETAKRRARRKRAMPHWVDSGAVRVFYEISRRASRCTGIKFHVDHIVPLQGSGVCGLHVPWNLQVLPARVNAIKSNKLGI